MRLALVHVGQLHGLPGRLLHRSSELLDLRPVLFVSGRHVERQKVAQRVDGQMHLAALLPLVAVVV